MYLWNGKYPELDKSLLFLSSRQHAPFKFFVLVIKVYVAIDELGGLCPKDTTTAVA